MKIYVLKSIMLLCLINVIQTASVSSIAPTNKRSMLKGCIKIDGEDHKVPEIAILFNGSIMKSNREGLFAFPLAGQNSIYKIVICKSLDQNFENANTIETISLPEGQRSRIITLNCLESEDGSLICESETCTEQSDGSLSCKARRPNEAKSINTQNSIILLIDPDHVERIEPWNVKLADNFTKLPRIVLKNKSKKELSAASAESLLYALDIKPFHEPIKGKKRRLSDGKVKLAVLN